MKGSEWRVDICCAVLVVAPACTPLHSNLVRASQVVLGVLLCWVHHYTSLLQSASNWQIFCRDHTSPQCPPCEESMGGE